MRPPNFLTVDVEEYYHANYAGFDRSRYGRERTNLPALVDRFLEIFAASDARCTFFILGSVAKRYPEIVRRIHGEGHEVASHGWDHQGIRGMSTPEMREDILKSCGILESVCGAKVEGFRAPSFSVDRETLPRFYNALDKCGLSYSSSVFPGRTFLYGIPGFPLYPHRPMLNGREAPVVEFPISGFSLFGLRFPLYMRLLSPATLRRRIAHENRHDRPAMLYVHPREIDPQQPRLPLSRMQSFIHYWAVRTCESKIDRLVCSRNVNFTTLRDYLTTCGAGFSLRGASAPPAVAANVSNI